MATTDQPADQSSEYVLLPMDELIVLAAKRGAGYYGAERPKCAYFHIPERSRSENYKHVVRIMRERGTWDDTQKQRWAVWASVAHAVDAALADPGLTNAKFRFQEARMIEGRTDAEQQLILFANHRIVDGGRKSWREWMGLPPLKDATDGTNP